MDVLTEAEIRAILNRAGIAPEKAEEIAKIWIADRIQAANWVAVGGNIIE